MLKYVTDIRLWYALIGLIISIVAHELFHIAAHINHIERIDLFPNIYTIVEVTVDSPGVLTHDAEEAIAYTITGLIIFITIIDIFAISDSYDRRTVNETLFPSKMPRIKSSKIDKRISAKR